MICWRVSKRFGVPNYSTRAPPKCCTASTSDKPDSAARSSLLRSTRNRIYYVCHCSPPLVGTIELYRTFDPGWSASRKLTRRKGFDEVGRICIDKSACPKNPDDNQIHCPCAFIES